MAPIMTDYLAATCRHCGHTVHITLEQGARRAKCPKCEGIIEISKGDTSVRLRSDRELNQEARAKAGRGPDTDKEIPAQRPGGRGTARMRRAAPPPKKAAKGGKLGLIIGLVAAAVVLIIIVIVLMKKSPGESAATPPPPPAMKAPTPPPPAEKKKPDEPPPDPRIETIKTRIASWVRTFNLNDLTKLAEYYTSDISALTRAFGNILTDSEIRYANVEVKAVEFLEPDIKTTLTLSRNRVYSGGGKVETQAGIERVLTWTLRDGKYVISSPPEP